MNFGVLGRKYLPFSIYRGNRDIRERTAKSFEISRNGPLWKIGLILTAEKAFAAAYENNEDIFNVSDFFCFINKIWCGFFLATASQEVCKKGPFPYKKDDRKILDCDFTDAAIRDILWYKDNKLLVNGSGGLYQSLIRLNHDTLRSSLLFQFVRFKHAGVYTCKPEPSQPVSNCPDGKSVIILVECKCSYDHSHLSWS